MAWGAGLVLKRTTEVGFCGSLIGYAVWDLKSGMPLRNKYTINGGKRKKRKKAYQTRCISQKTSVRVFVPDVTLPTFW